MDLVPLAIAPKVDFFSHTGKAKASRFGKPSSSLSQVTSRRSSFMSGVIDHKIKEVTGYFSQREGKPVTASIGSNLVATAFPDDDDDSDGENAGYAPYWESQILNLRTIRNIVIGVIAYYTGKDPRLVRRRVLVRDLPIDPMAQLAIECNIEKDLEFLLGPIRVSPVQMPRGPNATIEDFVQDIYEKLVFSIPLKTGMLPALSRMTPESTYGAEE